MQNIKNGVTLRQDIASEDDELQSCGNQAGTLSMKIWDDCLVAPGYVIAACTQSQCSKITIQKARTSQSWQVEISMTTLMSQESHVERMQFGHLREGNRFPLQPKRTLS